MRLGGAMAEGKRRSEVNVRELQPGPQAEDAEQELKEDGDHLPPIAHACSCGIKIAAVAR